MQHLALLVGGVGLFPAFADALRGASAMGIYCLRRENEIAAIMLSFSHSESSLLGKDCHLCRLGITNPNKAC